MKQINICILNIIIVLILCQILWLMSSSHVVSPVARSKLQQNSIDDNNKKKKHGSSALNMKGFDICPQSCIEAGGLESSTTHVWDSLESNILNASYFSHPGILQLKENNITAMNIYTNWIDGLYSFYTVSRLRRSVANPAEPKFIARLLKLAKEVQAHNNVPTNKKRTIRVLVLGGSVTAGHGCGWPAITGIQNPTGISPSNSCAWPSRLETLLNQVLFGGEHIFQVDNTASGGTTSEWGAMVLEYRLFKEPEHVPDIVISSFSANEAKEPNYETKVFPEYMQNFVKAAHSLHPCNENAPLIIMADDFYGDMPYQATRHTANVYMLSTWNNLMAINFASILKYKVLAEYSKEKTYHSLTGAVFGVHLGISFHIGMAWGIMFNILNSIVNVCNDQSINQNEDPKILYVGQYVVNGTTERKIDGVEPVSDTDEIPQGQIDPGLLSTLRQGEPPFKHFGPMRSGHGRAQDVAAEFKQNMADNYKLCNDVLESTSGQNKKCTYAWVVNHLTGPSRKEELKLLMEKNVFFNQGWQAGGRPIQQPRTGWYGKGENATFSMKVENITVDTNFLVLLTMKSYGPEFVNTRLAVLPTVVKAHVIADSFLDYRTVDFENNATFFIDGYHNTRTSVHFPYKVMIPGGAKVGDSIILDAKIVGGSHFKIAGLAFCSF